MRKYLTAYRGDRRAFSASTHVVAKRLSCAAYRAELLEEPEASQIIVIDVEASGYSAFDAAWQVLVCEASIKVEHSVQGVGFSENIPHSDDEIERRSFTIDPHCEFESAITPDLGKRMGESMWARLQQDDLDKVHDVWCRQGQRKGDQR